MKLFAAIAAAAIVTLLLACNGGDGGAMSSSETPSAEASPSSSPDLRTDPIEVIRAYLRDTGLDGKKGDLADPIDCSQTEDDADFCIIDDVSIYATGLTILHVADVDNPSEDVWQVHLNLDDGVWEVSDLKYFGPE